jgi:hypothetical protein
MAVTLPVDLCFHCHADVARERPSHKDMAFNTCAAGGCHNFHDNRALYSDFLVRHKDEPSVLSAALVPARTLSGAAHALLREDADAPAHVKSGPEVTAQWAVTAHARGGVNCRGCHEEGEGTGKKDWNDHPSHESCAACHKFEVQGFLGGKHGMRLAAGLSPMSPSLGRLPMAPSASRRTLGCGSCHSAHEFDTRRAAADACLECHADKHSLAYKTSPHYALWRAETDGNAAAGSGVNCATCHLPRVQHGEGDLTAVRVEHNQNANLRPNEKMIRDVCLSCHGLGFTLDALGDPMSIETNFRGMPARHVESIDMAVRKAAANQRSK